MTTIQNLTHQKRQNVLLVVVQTSDIDLNYTLTELKELVRTANGEVKLTAVQNRSEIDNATVVGKGKLQEIKAAVAENDIDVVIFNNNLSAIQRRNIEDAVDCTVIDKTDLILDIFALHATTNEGKKQVELAQLSYSLASKSAKNFSRQGGGIGTRGPGETQLEMDKRRIREKIYRLREELKQIQKQRQTATKQRLENDIFTIAIVGYTNAGKSTLFNRLTSADVLAEDLLFATLDTTTRKIKLKNQIEVLISDTVGFIKDLPHNLIEAFKATLNELATANLVLNVVDINDENAEVHVKVTEEILNSLNVAAERIIVYNKVDLNVSYNIFNQEDNEKFIYVSSKTGKNIDKLCEMIFQKAMMRYVHCNIHTTASDFSKLLPLLNKYCASFTTAFDEEEVKVDAIILRKNFHNFSKFDKITIL